MAKPWSEPERVSSFTESWTPSVQEINGLKVFLVKNASSSKSTLTQDSHHGVSLLGYHSLPKSWRRTPSHIIT
ncbi:hypothetical protein PGIGA_G00020860 [Pangasianodon gigas]|uniref:Uncharacterized protein n=1 Tax=Pangasianodon gigas TaxID=30993 RepID=A0ACC5WV41_PANGG|nr:hypothetical protein [Pangasianodon gigas]